jgi:NADPH:quinone reductase-like Zn-dependent oxidoreductase
MKREKIDCESEVGKETNLTLDSSWNLDTYCGGVDREAHHFMLEELASYCDSGMIRCHLTSRIKLTANGLKRAHELIESKTTIGKIGLGVDEEGPEEAFA